MQNRNHKNKLRLTYLSGGVGADSGAVDRRIITDIDGLSDLNGKLFTLGNRCVHIPLFHRIPGTATGSISILNNDVTRTYFLTLQGYYESDDIRLQWFQPGYNSYPFCPSALNVQCLSNRETTVLVTKTPDCKYVRFYALIYSNSQAANAPSRFRFYGQGLEHLRDIHFPTLSSILSDSVPIIGIVPGNTNIEVRFNNTTAFGPFVSVNLMGYTIYDDI